MYHLATDVAQPVTHRPSVRRSPTLLWPSSGRRLLILLPCGACCWAGRSMCPTCHRSAPSPAEVDSSMQLIGTSPTKPVFSFLRATPRFVACVVFRTQDDGRLPRRQDSLSAAAVVLGSEPPTLTHSKLSCTRSIAQPASPGSQLTPSSGRGDGNAAGTERPHPRRVQHAAGQLHKPPAISAVTR